MNSILLSGECTIYEIAQLHQKIHNNWHGKTELNLDVSAVTEVDASFVQLLASCKMTADCNKQAFQLLNTPESLKNKIDALFLQDFFSNESHSNDE